MKQLPRHSAKKFKGRRSWTSVEDAAIRQLVELYGTKQWTLVAEKLSSDFKIFGRTGKQCRERWHNHLDFGITKHPWSYEDEQTLFQLHSQIGNKWAEISKSMPGRTDNAVKNHFYSTLRKQYRKVYGAEPTKDQLKQHISLLAAGILNKSSEESTEAREEDLGEVFLIDDLELFLCGHQASFGRQFEGTWAEPEVFLLPLPSLDNEYF